jgi:putative transposase
VWTADITYVPTWSGWLYLAVVLDCFSRRVVGWAMAEQLRTELVIDALEMAIWNRQPTRVWSTTATRAANLGSRGGRNIACC